MYRMAKRITRGHPIGLGMFWSVYTNTFEIWNLYAKNIIFAYSLPTLTSNTWNISLPKSNGPPPPYIFTNHAEIPRFSGEISLSDPDCTLLELYGREFRSFVVIQRRKESSGYPEFRNWAQSPTLPLQNTSTAQIGGGFFFATPDTIPTKLHTSKNPTIARFLSPSSPLLLLLMTNFFGRLHRAATM
jgi:hypothetical protein